MAISWSPALALLTVIATCFGCGDARATVAPEADKHGHHEHDHEHGHKDDHKHDDHDHKAGEGAPAAEPHDHSNEVHLSPEAIKRYGITVAPASRRALAPTFTAAARVAFNAEKVAHVGSHVSGRVVELKARPGDEVKAGDVLLVVESPEYGEAQGEYIQRRITAEVAAAAVKTAKAAYERAQSLRQQNDGISLADLQRREAEFQAAQGAARTADAALSAIRNKLALMGFDKAAADALADSGNIDPRVPVRSPLAGRVVEREVTLGERVTPEREALAVVADLRTVWVLAEVPEARVGEVAVGARAHVRLASAPDNAIEGAVSYIAPSLDPATRTGRVRIEVPNDAGALRPGMFARVEIAAGPPAGAANGQSVVVPEAAVQTVEGRPAVFVPVKGEPNTFQKRPVTVGRPAGGMVPVLSGLREGEGVVVAGTFILKAELGKAEAGHGHEH